MKLLIDENLERIIRSLILSFWPDRKNDFFPGPLPVSIEKVSFIKLQKYPYLICPKSDGIRYFMIVYDKICYLVDRNFKIYETDIVTESSKMSLFDGELITDFKNVTKYIIHDCVCFDDVSVSNDNFDERYVAIKNYISEYNDNDKNPSIKIFIKKFYNFDQIPQFKKYISTIDHKIDGYIMTPINLPIGTGTQHSLFKWKPLDKHTFDFKIIETNDEYLLYMSEGPDIKIFASVGKLSTSGIQYSKMLEKIGFQRSEEGTIVECTYKDSMYQPIMLRPDKSHPNSYRTIERTMFNIKEGITEEELFNRNAI